MAAPARSTKDRHDPALVAHVLRRVTFAPTVEQFDRWLDAGVDELIAWALDSPPLPPDPASGAGPDDLDAITAGWFRRLRSPEAALHERLTWFWHGHFTTSADKVSEPPLLWRQQKMLRTHALGNFATFARAVVTDAAMLRYLDADPSTAQAPNENLGREFLELFTLGHGAYSQADVRAAALALAGWTVDWDDGHRVHFVPENAHVGPLTFLGRTGPLDVDELVARVCSHEACAPHVAGRVHRFLVGTAPSDSRRRELAEGFRRSGLDLRRLVTDIVTHPSFFDLELGRPRYPVEWLAAALTATAVDGRDRETDKGNDMIWWLYRLGQVPYRPPNVGGWPAGDRWLGPAQLLARAGLVGWMELPDDLLEGADPVEEVLRRCLIVDPSPQTLAALEAAAREAEAWDRTVSMFTIALTSPEFAVL